MRRGRGRGSASRASGGKARKRQEATLQQGTVVEVHGIRATVLLHEGDGTRVRCRPPRDRTTPAVGDRVQVLQNKHGNFIETIDERERALWRPKDRGRALMAAHVDRVIVVGATEPTLKAGFFDRILVATETVGIETLIVVNKADLEGHDEALALLTPMQDLGYRVMSTSAATGEGVYALRDLVGRGISVVIGQSGVGKSTLLNALIPGLKLETGELSDHTGKGKHTTTVTTCHEVGARWPGGGLVVDTPGIRTFGLYDLELKQLAEGFVEMEPLRHTCKFRDCLHEPEQPECAVVAAVDAGDIELRRYDSYLGILDSVRDGEG